MGLLLGFGRRHWRFAALASLAAATSCGGNEESPFHRRTETGGADGGEAEGGLGGTAGSGGAQGGGSARGGRGGTAGSSGASGRGGDGVGGDGAGAGAGGDAGTSGRGGSAGRSGDGGEGGEPPTTITIVPTGLPRGQVGREYAVELSATGSLASDFDWSLDGTPPPGFTFTDHATGPGATLAGTPTEAGEFDVRVSVTDDDGVSAQRIYPLLVLTRPWFLYATTSDGYAVDLSGDVPGGPLVLNRPLGIGESVSLGDAQPRGGRHFFYVDSAEHRDVWLTNLAGDGPTLSVRVNSPFASAGGRVRAAQFSPDGRLIGYPAREGTMAPYESFVAPVTGVAPGAPVKVSGTLPLDGSAEDFFWRGGSVFYGVSSPTSGPAATPATRLYSVDVATLPPPAPVPAHGWDAATVSLSPDGHRVAYLVRTGATTGELWAVGVLGAQPQTAVRLHNALGANETAGRNVVWSNDSARIFFTIENQVSARKDLYRTLFDGTGVLPADRVNAGAGTVVDYRLSPDDLQVLYVESLTPGMQDYDLWLSDVRGANPSPPERVNGSFVTGGGLASATGAVTFGWSPDARDVAYVADALVDGSREAFIVNVTGQPTTPRRLNTSLPSASAAVEDFAFAPNSSVVLLYGDLETAGRREAFAVPLTASAPGLPVKISGTLGTNEQVKLGAWSADNVFVGLVVFDTVLGSGRAAVVRYNGEAFAAPLAVSAANQDVTDFRFFASGF